MARTGSSSKKKSIKKKSDKKKKSKRNEFKKSHRDYKSDDDDSSVSKRSSSSTSQSDYKRRMRKSKNLRRRDFSSNSDSDPLSTHENVHKSKKRRNSQIDSKLKKKKSRKRYSSPDSDADEDRVRKQKRLSKVLSCKPKKKSSRKKKKSKKHLSSSSNSDSESFSTCQSSSSSSTEEGKIQKTKAKMPSKEISTEFHKGHKKRKVRTPSCEPNDAELPPVNNTRRLKSVIVPAPPPSEEIDRWETDHHHKEEIVYEYDDYPSSRSVDSNEGENKREADNHSNGTSNKRIRVGHVEMGGDIATELGKSPNNFIDKKESDKSVPVAALGGGDNLESILRQKALENLRKFKVGNRTVSKNISNTSTNNEKNVIKGLSSETVDILENKPTKLHSLNTEGANQRSGLTSGCDFSHFADSNKHSDGGIIEEEAGMVKQTVSDPPNEGTPLSGYSEDKSISSNAVCGARAVSRNKIDSFATKPTSSGKDSIEEQLSQANADSEYEKKTMLVMRGGEMVQVSYKVYIPKRIPALGRRPLRR